MAIALTRVDFRLIHGQVVTQWVRRLNIDRIDVVDTSLSKEPFMKNVLSMSAPKGVKVNIISTDDSLKKQENGFYSDTKSNYLLLFKTVQQLHEAMEKGLALDEIQIGGLGGGPDRKAVSNAITLNEEDANWLTEIQEDDTKVYLQTTPDYPSMSLNEAVSKL